MTHGLPDYWDTATRALSRQDTIMAGLIRHHPVLQLRSSADPFLALARSVVGQQISTRAADTIWARLVATEDSVTPDLILRLRMEELRACGLSQQKANYIRGIAEFFDGATYAWKNLSDAEIRALLLPLKGVGHWTVDMFLMFHLWRPDILPLSDMGVRTALQKHYFGGQKTPTTELQHMGENWKPWRSVAAWHLWRSLSAP